MIIDGMTKERSNGTTIYRWNIFSEWCSKLKLGLTTRTGGVSPAPYRSLNLGRFVGDLPANFVSNRRLASIALGLPQSNWVMAKQVHGNRVITIDEGDSGTVAGDTIQDVAENYSEGDAFLIRTTGVSAAICLADCLPVLVYDPRQHIGAICHAGWKGTAAGVVDAAVKRMLEFGSRRKDLVAAVGPGIGACCYQVSENLVGQFNEGFNYPENVVTHSPDGAISLNLEEANYARLLSLGIDRERIGRAGFCSACRLNEFFSYRKEEGLTGRHAVVMNLL